MKTQYMNTGELESPSLPFYVSRVVPRPSPPHPFHHKEKHSSESYYTNFRFLEKKHLYISANEWSFL